MYHVLHAQGVYNIIYPNTMATEGWEISYQLGAQSF